MPRACSAALAAHLAGPATTICFLLKVTPKNAAVFGITTLDRDVTYDDGNGAVTYRAKRGYTAMDVATHADMSVDNSEASGLLAEYPADGVTAQGIAAGNYDGAAFVQYLVNYMDLSMGHVIINSGRVGQVTNINDLTVNMEMRSLEQILKQISIIELTSLSCRAKFGDTQCKLPFAWNAAKVQSVGAEADRTFNICAPDGTALTFADGYFKPGVAVWTSGANDGIETEVETFAGTGQTVTLVFPVPTDIQIGDLLNIRRDCGKSKQNCIDYGNIVNFRGEPEIPVGNGMDLQAPTPSNL